MTPMISRARWALLLAALLVGPRAASAHFLWITAEPAAEGSRGPATVRVFLNETPEPGGPGFLKFVRDVKPTVDGQPLAAVVGAESLDAGWVGPLPAKIDAGRDLGIKSKEGKSYRLVYTARLQAAPAKVEDAEAGDTLRVRQVTKDEKGAVQVLFNGKPAAKARIKGYPEAGEATEVTADEQGLAVVEGLAEGKTALWANWVDGVAGEVDGKKFDETRYYATLTVRPVAAAKDGSAAVATAFAELPAPAVNSFGGAVLGDWLYVYGGHVGKTHEYSVETTSKHFRRLSLKDRTTWEDLPMGPDVQGVALVTDGKYLYRNGGMAAKNQPGDDHDLYSVADFARFDPEAKTWTDLAPMPVPRSTHDAVVVGRKVYAVGGWTMKGATEKAEYLKDTVAFDLDHPESGWQAIPQPFRRRALSVAEAGGKLYVLGGLTDLMKVQRQVDVYDATTGTWSVGPELPAGAKNEGFGTSAFGVDGRPYFSGVTGRIFRLDAAGAAWEAVGAWSVPRITHRVLPGPDHALLAVGGNAKGKQVSVIEAVTLPTLAAPTTAASR